MDFTSEETKKLNQFSGFLKFVFNWPFKKFISCSEKIILLVYGNQGGKTGGTAFSYVLRIMGLHPIAKKNVLYFECKNEHAVAPTKLPEDKICKECGEELLEHERGSRVFRFCAQNLPGQTTNVSEDGLSAEVRNTQYPEFKKWLPPFLIKKDITFRSPSMIIKDPYGGPDIVVEFVSYNQSTQGTAGVQRMSIWCDEAPSFDFYEEQLPRLISEDGDIIFTYTPVDRSSWLFDEFFDKAKVYYRSKDICSFVPGWKEEEVTDSPHSIAVVMAATDDNPTLKKSVIDAMFDHIDDPDVISIRRYGIFKQLSGRIYKNFNYETHYINGGRYFPEGIPYNWTHARGIDYHPQTPWAVGMISLSPNNEAFIWGEYNPSPEKYTVREIAHKTASMGGDFKFRLNLIDPLSEATLKDRLTIREELNDIFRELRKEGLGTGGSWKTWDTKGEKGREAIKERLKNSLEVKRPFNNKTVRGGKETYLPTIWILDTCKVSGKSFRNWRWEEWADAKSRVTKEDKNKPEQRWSHFPMVYEACFKEAAFRPSGNRNVTQRTYDYFGGNK